MLSLVDVRFGRFNTMMARNGEGREWNLSFFLSLPSHWNVRLEQFNDSYCSCTRRIVVDFFNG